MKRAEPEKSEIQILMRAVRDVNLPKFVDADFGIFLGLILDLFPKVDSPKQTDPVLTEAVTNVLKDPEGGLVRDDGDVFVSKIISLAELFSVRPNWAPASAKVFYEEGSRTFSSVAANTTRL